MLVYVLSYSEVPLKALTPLVNILENVEHRGGKPEQADAMHIHLPFTGGFKRGFALLKMS